MLIAAAMAACSLLTPAEIARVQGEAPTESKPSEHPGPLPSEQCLYLLPTFANSVSLDLTRGAKAHWKKVFHERHEAEEGEEQAPPRRVRGLGDEAFWVGDSRIFGLYVLKKDSMLRLSIGGKGTVEEKQKRLRALAKTALSRL
jgi:hypothetical protein